MTSSSGIMVNKSILFSSRTSCYLEQDKIFPAWGVFEWLEEQGCPWVEKHCPCPDENNFPYSLYEKQISPAVLEWCLSNGYGSRINASE